MTRHNIGFEILDQISENNEVKFESRRFGDIIKLKKGGKSLIFLKPNTFMNLSGKAVKYWKNKERINNDNLLVVLDDLNLDFGVSRLRKSGKDGGHNGLKSINVHGAPRGLELCVCHTASGLMINQAGSNSIEEIPYEPAE